MRPRPESQSPAVAGAGTRHIDGGGRFCGMLVSALFATENSALLTSTDSGSSTPVWAMLTGTGGARLAIGGTHQWRQTELPIEGSGRNAVAVPTVSRSVLGPTFTSMTCPHTAIRRTG